MNSQHQHHDPAADPRDPQQDPRTVAARVVAGLTEMRDSLACGEPLEQRFKNTTYTKAQDGSIVRKVADPWQVNRYPRKGR